MQKIAKRSEKRLVSHNKTQHVENYSPLRISVTVKIILRAVIAFKDNRSHVFIMSFSKILVLFP